MNFDQPLESVFDTLLTSGAIWMVLGAMAFGLLLDVLRKSLRQKRKGQRHTPPSLSRDGTVSLRDPRAQMEYVAKADFETCPLLNKEEARLLPILERAARTAGENHRVMAQTSMGEVLRPKKEGLDRETRDLAFRSINSKRLDFAVINRSGHLVCAIEYQGSGHYHQTTFMRDAVKKEVLRKAGVRFVEVEKGFDPNALYDDVLNALGGSRTAAPQKTEPQMQRPENS